MSNAVAVTDADFEQEIEKHDGLAVVDFWATWCGPCRMIAPILDQLAVEYQGKAKVTKLDVDSNIRTGNAVQRAVDSGGAVLQERQARGPGHRRGAEAGARVEVQAARGGLSA